MATYRDVPVNKITVLENPPQQHTVEEFRLKLMEIADKVEAGVYSVASMNLVACNFENRDFTVGQLNVTQLADGQRRHNWLEIQADIPDEEDFMATYDTFIDDSLVLFDMQPIDGTSRESCEVVIGTDESADYSIRFVER